MRRPSRRFEALPRTQWTRADAVDGPRGTTKQERPEKLGPPQETQLPNGTACENGLAKVTAFLPERRKWCQNGELRLPKVVADLALAERFQGLLDAGEVKNRADLARRFRLTRARVTQLIDLLRLHPTIRAYLRLLPPGTPTRMVTERGLRAVVRLPGRQQIEAARRFRGFDLFLAKEAERVA
jgi:hypothetical protein